jgi:YD repeat-containing protein
MATPNGTSVSFGVEMGLGMPRVNSKSQPAGSGCAAASSLTYYDVNYLVRATVDFNSTKTCFDNDTTRRLETARVEGLAHTTESCQYPVSGYVIPAGSAKRKVSTQWHPIWTLKTRVAEPLRITTLVYNGQPDPTGGNAIASCAPASALLMDGTPIAVLCKQVEQATTDATGSLGFAATATGVPRTYNYTYNAFGQVLTAKDPLSHTTTYSYFADTTIDHTLGDLQTVTNAAGHVTQYTKYDKSGRLLRSIDPNGVTTDMAYTPRGWVSSITITPPVGGGSVQTSTFTYDNVGQLKEAVLPDATTITYTYDAAHRLTGVKDGAGNVVTYTLDNMGNRTGEQLKDAGGVLAKNMTRVFDALNRVQSVTGAQP